MGGLPDWLEAWFAERESGCRACGVDVALRIRPADWRPVRRRKNAPDAQVDVDFGNRYGNVSVFAEGGVSVIGLDFVGDVAWQADLHPQAPADFDVAVDQVLAWVEATAEMPSWART
ncbi:hypothetical protein [Streptomyces sp. NPDC090445]|uniref:hypothetical protein n=1 Tax=Streptomyces sp. NPDC090445 TaxID=3365963 RepID=UPI0037FEE971